MTKSKKPAIRFKGFTDDWEQRKLREVADIVGGGTPSTSVSEYWDGDIDWYVPAEIGDTIFVNNSKRKITKLGLDKSSARILPIGTVLFTSRAGIGNTAILSKEGATNQGFQSIIPKVNQLESYFIYSKTSELKRYGEITGAGSTFVEVSGKQMAKMPVAIPKINEQTKIGNFFKQLDETITLQERELELLKEQKKGFLQKMFPKQNEKVPELRFEGFTDDWEQRKLGELLTEIKRPLKIADETDYQLVTVKRRNGGIVSRGIFKGKTILVKNYFELQEGDFLISKRQVVHGATGIVPKNLDKAIVSNEYLVSISNENISTEFLTILSKLPQMYKMYFLSSYGIDIEKLVFDVADWKKRKISIPKTEEQKKISNFFKQLDKTIALQEQQLEKMKEMKKGFLQKMFV